jgi:hypothetical protein
MIPGSRATGGGRTIAGALSSRLTRPPAPAAPVDGSNKLPHMLAGTHLAEHAEDLGEHKKRPVRTPMGSSRQCRI